MNVIILGPQGSGKGTQADLISKNLGYFHMESGKLLRQLAKENERIAQMINNGILVPDEETIEYIEAHLNKNHGSFDQIIFDGYPRTVMQYELLNKWAQGHGKNIDLVLFIDISRAETIKRLSARRTCEKCGTVYNLITNPPPSEDACACGGKLVQREDDKPETIEKRLDIFTNQTRPILEIAEKEGKLVKVDGERPINDIYQDLEKAIKERNA